MERISFSCKFYVRLSEKGAALGLFSNFHKKNSEMFKMILKAAGFLLLVLVIVYFVGPKAAEYKWDRGATQTALIAMDAEEFVRIKESKMKIREGNESQFYWVDSAHQKTPYVLLYIHLSLIHI